MQGIQFSNAQQIQCYATPRFKASLLMHWQPSHLAEASHEHWGMVCRMCRFQPEVIRPCTAALHAFWFNDIVTNLTILQRGAGIQDRQQPWGCWESTSAAMLPQLWQLHCCCVSRAGVGLMGLPYLLASTELTCLAASRSARDAVAAQSSTWAPLPPLYCTSLLGRRL